MSMTTATCFWNEEQQATQVPGKYYLYTKCSGRVKEGSIYISSLYDCMINTSLYRQGVYIKLFKTDSDLCPYKLLRKLIMNRKSSNTTEKDLLFVEEHSIALSRNYFISKLKTLLSYFGFVHSDYSGHSFRIWTATTCASNGIQDHMMQTLGRWKSNCFMRYIRTSDGDIISVQKMMCHWLCGRFTLFCTFVYIFTGVPIMLRFSYRL